MLRHNGLEPQTTTLRTIASGAPSGPLAVWVTRKGAVRLADVRGARGTLAAARKSLGPGTTRAAYGNCRATWASLGAIMTFSPARGGSTCGDDARLRAAVLTGPQWVTAKGLKPGDSVAKARKLYGKKVARGSMGVLVRSKSGARLTARMGEGVVKALIVAVPRRR